MNITVFGAAKSGLAVAEKMRRGNSMFITEAKERVDAKVLRRMRRMKVRYELGGHSMKAIKNADLIVLSPGVRFDLPILKKARKLGLPVIGEIELAYSIIKKPIIAVTGTNGKTTTTSLIGDMLSRSGLRVVVAGNIGKPLISVNDKNLDMVVAEISSYQLESADTFKPWISAILNVTPDHLTRHGTMKEYIKNKAAIFRNQNACDNLVYNHDDSIVRGMVNDARCEKVPFSRKRVFSSGAYVSSGYLCWRGEKIVSVDKIKIQGLHNLENSLAAAAVAKLCGVSNRDIAVSLKSFKGVEHRIEFVRKVKGVSFYNDSKGTNPDSTIVAINALFPASRIVLILGGRDKMTDLSCLSRLVKRKVKEVVLIGEAKKRIRDSLVRCGYDRIHETSGFKDAVRRSYRLAKPGDAVLLSPACASFDMFRDYEHRGKVFKKIVTGL